MSPIFGARDVPFSWPSYRTVTPKPICGAGTQHQIPPSGREPIIFLALHSTALNSRYCSLEHAKPRNWVHRSCRFLAFGPRNIRRNRAPKHQSPDLPACLPCNTKQNPLSSFRQCEITPHSHLFRQFRRHCETFKSTLQQTRIKSGLELLSTRLESQKTAEETGRILDWVMRAFFEVSGRLGVDPGR